MKGEQGKGERDASKEGYDSETARASEGRRSRTSVNPAAWTRHAWGTYLERLLCAFEHRCYASSSRTATSTRSHSARRVDAGRCRRLHSGVSSSLARGRSRVEDRRAKEGGDARVSALGSEMVVDRKQKSIRIQTLNRPRSISISWHVTQGHSESLDELDAARGGFEHVVAAVVVVAACLSLREVRLK